MKLGKVVCVPEASAARARDEAFFSGKVPPQPAFPGLSGGLVARDAPHAGTLLPHDDLEKDGRTASLDAITGRRFALLIEQPLLAQLSSGARALIETLDLAVVPIGAGGYRDIHGRIAGMLARDKIGAVIARPDFYAFGGAATTDAIENLLQDLSNGLAV